MSQLDSETSRQLYDLMNTCKFLSRKEQSQMLKKKILGLVLGSMLLVGLMALFSPPTFAASHTPQASGCVANGAIIANPSGTITAGMSGTLTSGASMNCVKTILVTAKNKAGSVSAITFVFTQKNCGVSGCVDVGLGSLRVTPSNTRFASYPASPAGLSSTLTVTANAEPGSGLDAFVVTVQAFTS